MSSETARPNGGGYLLAALSVAAAAAISWGVPGISRSVPYACFFLASVVVAVRAGLVPGLLAAAAGAVAAQFVIAATGGATSLVPLLEFVVTSGVTVWAIAARRVSSAQNRATSALVAEVEALRRENKALADAKRSAPHKLVQPLGAITNYAEVIRAQSTGSVRDSAASIIDVAQRAAANIRQQLDGSASGEAPGDPVKSAASAPVPAGEDPAAKPRSSLAGVP